MTRLSRGITLLVLFATLLAVPLRAADTYWELYEEGKSAVEAGRFAQGRDLLLQALEKRSAQGSHRIGMKTLDYYPSHQIAKAYLELGDLQQAEVQLKLAESVKSKSSTEEALLGELRGRFERALREHAATPEPAPVVAPPLKPQGPSAAARLAQTAFDRGELVEARRAAEQALAADPGDAAARRVRDDVRSYVAVKVAAARDEVDAGALDAAEARLEDALRIEPDQAEARRLLGTVQAKRAAAREAEKVARADVKPPVKPLQPPEKPTQAAEARVRPEPVVEPPPPGLPAPAQEALRAGLTAFFEGRIPECIEQLEKALRGHAPAPEALAVLAAAHATRGLVAGDRQGATDTNRARALFQQALQNRRELQLDRRYFSPLVIDMLDEVRRAQAP